MDAPLLVLSALASSAALLALWLSGARRCVKALPVLCAAALAVGVAVPLARTGKMEQPIMAKSKSKSKAARRSTADMPPPADPAALRLWLAVAEEIGPPPKPGMVPVQAYVCGGVRTPPWWEGK